MTKLDRWIDQQNAMETPKRVDPTLFAPAEHVHPYLPIGGKAVDSDMLDGLDSTAFGRLASAQTWAGANTFSQPVVLDGYTLPTGRQALSKDAGDSYYSLSNHHHNTQYLGISAQATDSARLGGQLPSYYARASDIPAPYTPPVWQSWTPTATGWSMINLIRACRFRREGNTVYFNVYVYGQSNSTGASISLPPGLPAINITNLYWRGISAGMDNGERLTTPIMWQISPGGTEIFCYSSTTAEGWTASGAKLVAFQGFYETSAT